MLITCEFPDKEKGLVEIGQETSEGGWFVRIVNNRKFDLFEYKIGSKEQLVDTFTGYSDAVKNAEKLT